MTFYHGIFTLKMYYKEDDLRRAVYAKGGIPRIKKNKETFNLLIALTTVILSKKKKRLKYHERRTLNLTTIFNDLNFPGVLFPHA